MIGKILGKALSLPVRVANLPAEAVDRVGDYMMNEEHDPDPRGVRLAGPGKGLASEIERLLETLDE